MVPNTTNTRQSLNESEMKINADHMELRQVDFKRTLAVNKLMRYLISVRMIMTTTFLNTMKLTPIVTRSVTKV